MKYQTLKLAALVVTTVMGASLMLSKPAAAGTCLYMAHDPSGKMMADGWATARKMSRACNRARRRCNRELERKRRRGDAGRGGCKRMQQAG